MSDIDPTRAAQLITDGSHVLIDVREDGEWAAGHAPQARHVALGAIAATDFPAGTPLIAVCRSGGRSSQAVTELVARGVDAHNLTGGMQAWAQAGLPVTDADGRPGTVD